MNLLALPTRMKDLQTVLQALDWHTLEHEVAQEAQSRLAIVGPVNSGKSTLFNYFHGHNLSATGAVPGTTQGIVEHPFGPFVLMDTPGFGEVWGVDRATIAHEAAQHADLIILLLDASAGIRQDDQELYKQLQTLGHPIVVALNKTDLIKKDLPWVLENAEKLLGVCPIPISARTGKGITQDLIPAILQLQPALGIAMARELPAVREHIVNRIIRQTAWANMIIALEPIPGLDIPLLLAAQTRMVLRIAAAYGQSLQASHARELLTTMAGGLLTRYLGGQLAKFIPGPGWFISGVLSGISTWAIGEVARRYFEGGRQIRGPELKTLYQRMRKLAPTDLFKRRPKQTPPTEAESPTVAQGNE